jgi:ABC-2 type transport system permease protein
MMEDIKSVMWKEWREITRGGLRTRFFPLIILLLFCVVILPNALRTGKSDWTESLVLLVWLPFLFSANIIADSVAGERERHTLETLLASRLPDKAIVLGKMLMTILYSWGLTMAGAALGLVIANLESSAIVVYPTDVLTGILLLSFLAAVFVSALGVLVSLKARTTREAQQIIALSSLIIPFGSLLVIPILPSGVISLLFGGGLDMVMLVIGAILFIVGALLTVVALTQFKRTKLMVSA